MKLRLFAVAIPLLIIILLTSSNQPALSEANPVLAPLQNNVKQGHLSQHDLQSTPNQRTGTEATRPYSISSQMITDVTGIELAGAMGIPVEDIVSTDFNGSDVRALGIGTSPLGHFFPVKSNNFAIMSTGLAESAYWPNNEGNLSFVLDGLKNSQGNDLVQFFVELTVPSGVNCASFDFAFYSEEFPEWVGSAYNDTFTAEFGGTNLVISGNQVIAPLNFAFDIAGEIISVNTVSGVFEPTNSTYDGMTALRKARTPVQSGENVVIVFSIQDLGDSVYDSAVFLDNFAWTNDPSCAEGITPPPNPQSNLLLHMPGALPLNAPVRPTTTVLNHYTAPVNYTVVIQLWQGFTQLDEQVQQFSFTSSDVQQHTFDFGVYAPGPYYIWAELWQGGERLEVQSHSFVIGSDYLKLKEMAGRLSNAAYDELNQGLDIAVDSLATAAAAGTAEAVEFGLSHLISAIVQLGDIAEVDADVAADTGIELGDWFFNFSTAISKGTYNGASNFWTNNLNERTFNSRRSDVHNTQDELLDWAYTQTFTWNPAWEADVVRYEETLRNINEFSKVGLGIELDFSPPFLHRATLTQMKGQFDWVDETLLPGLATVSKWLLYGLVTLLLVALVLIKLPIAAAALVVTGGKAVLFLWPIVKSLFALATTAKLLASVLVLMLFAILIGETAENYASPVVVNTHQEAIDYLSDLVNPSLHTDPLLQMVLSAEVNRYHTVTKLDVFEGEPANLNLQLFRGDGQILEMKNYGSMRNEAQVEQEWILPPGTYWTIAAARSNDEVQVQKTTFQVSSPDVALEMQLASNQLALGQPVQATMNLVNQDSTLGTGSLVVTLKTLDNAVMQLWFPELGPGESISYSYSFVPQTIGGYVLRATVGNEVGILAIADRAFAVGDVAAIALQINPEDIYSPGQDIKWTVTAINVGTQPTNTTVLLNTYNRDNYSLVHTEHYDLNLDASASTTFALNILPDGVPGSYTTHLDLNGQLYRIDNFLVEAEGKLFVLMQAEPSFVSPAGSVSLTVEVQDEMYASTNANVTLDLRTPNGDITEVILIPTVTGHYEATYTPSIPGTYEVKVSASKPNYAGATNSTFFVNGENSLLIVTVQDQLILDTPKPITFTVHNEYLLPVADALVIISTDSGVLTGKTNSDGTVSLILNPTTTEPVTAQFQKSGYADTILNLPVAVVPDTTPPALSLILPEFTNQSSLQFNGTTEPGAIVTVMSQEVPVMSNGIFTATVQLEEGENIITAVATDNANNSTVLTKVVTLDTIAPMLSITWPSKDFSTNDPVVNVTGVTEPDVGLLVNDLSVEVRLDGSFSAWVLLEKFGVNTTVVLAIDRAGNTTVEEQIIYRSSNLYLPLVIYNP